MINLVVVWKDSERGNLIFPASEAWIYEAERVGYICPACFEESDYENKFKDIQLYLKLYYIEFYSVKSYNKMHEIIGETPEYMHQNDNYCSPREIKRECQKS